jgi:cell surface protein SprA
MDLPDPENTSSEPEYNPETNLYYFRNRVGNTDVGTPFTMTGDEYLNYSLRESMNNYWREKVKNDTTAGGSKSKFDLSNINLNLGGRADNIFGPGGVQVKLQGSAELLFGFKINKVQNPTLSERMRNPPPIFDFDQKIQLTANVKVGDKINFNMNYNTEASFDQDQSQIKLAYEGKEDEIIRSFEAGNVTMPLNSSLIRGSSALFGFKTELQFGKLSVAAVLSQQQSETKNVSLKNGAQTTEFDITADSYDENRHFFLSHYFRDNFEKSMGRLPNLNSNVVINRVEVWITNKTFMFEQARNVVAFMDLGETSKIDNSHWQVVGGATIPSNNANTLYREVIAIPNIRDIQQVNSIMDGL